MSDDERGADADGGDGPAERGGGPGADGDGTPDDPGTPAGAGDERGERAGSGADAGDERVDDGPDGGGNGGDGDDPDERDDGSPGASAAGSGPASAPRTAPWMADGTAAAEETTLEDIAAEEEVPEGTPSIGYLPSLPEAFVSLGAGCLAAATLLSLGAFAFVIWMRVTGNVRDLMPWEVTLAAILMAVSTVFLAGGTYFALKRVRWTLAMLAALVGSFAILTIPFTAVAVVCIGLTRVHFTAPFVGDAPTDADGAGAEEP